MGKKKEKKPEELKERMILISPETKKAIANLGAQQAESKRQIQQLQISMAATSQAIGMLLLTHLDGDEEVKSYDEKVGALVVVKKPKPKSVPNPNPNQLKPGKKRDKKTKCKKRK